MPCFPSAAMSATFKSKTEAVNSDTGKDVYPLQSDLNTPSSSSHSLASSLDHNENCAASTGHDQQCRAFCSRDNVENSLAYLSKELNMHGFQTLFQNGKDTLDLVGLVNVTYELLQLQKKNMKMNEELENRNIRTCSDMDYLHSNQIRLKENLLQTERTVARLQETERQLGLQVKTLLQKLKSEKEEVKRLNSVQQQREAQYQHEIRKREREGARLKERLHQLLGSHPQDRRPTIEMLNNLQRKDGTRGKWKTSTQEVKQEEDFYRTLIKDFEDRHRYILEENANLRQILVFIAKELSSVQHHKLFTLRLKSVQTLLEARPVEEALHHSLTESSQVSCSSGHLEDDEYLPVGQFYMPVDFAEEKIKKNVEEKFQQLNDCLQRVDSILIAIETRKDFNGKSEVACLHDQVNHYEEVINRQEHLLQQALINSPQQSGCSYLEDEHLIEEKARLKKEKLYLAAQKRNFEEERRLFNEAAVQLNRERQEFEEDQADFIKKRFFDGNLLSPLSFSGTPRPSAAEQTCKPSTPDCFQVYLSRSSDDIRYHDNLEHGERPESAQSVPGGKLMKIRPSKMQGCLADLEVPVVSRGDAQTSGKYNMEKTGKSKEKCTNASESDA